MFAKHPLDLTRDRLDERALAEALRLAIIAELDAVSFYLQVAARSPDPDVKKVFEDVAREEKVHFGEFLSLLQRYDPEQKEKLEEGIREVEELLGKLSSKETRLDGGGKEPSPSSLSVEVPESLPSTRELLEDLERMTEGLRTRITLVEQESDVANLFAREAHRLRLLRRHLPVTKLGPGIDYVAAPVVAYSGSAVGVEAEAVIPLREISIEFLIPQRLLNRAGRLGEPAYEAVVAQAARRLVASEERIILDALLSTEGALEANMGGWERPGEAVDDVARAIARMETEGITGPYVLIVSPQRYAKLLAVHEKTGVMELARLEKLAKVVRHPLIGQDKAILVPVDKTVLDVVIGVDTKVDHIGLEAGAERYRAWETLALRVRYPRGVTILTQA